VKAVKSLQGSDVTELKGFKSVTEPVKLVAKTPCKKNILTAALLGKLQNYPKDNIEESLVLQVQPILEEENYSEAKLINASKAAFGISKWCRAIIGYHGAMKVVVPKRIELKEAKESAAAAQKVWDAAKERLAGV
jgi:hypothetical protein